MEDLYLVYVTLWSKLGSLGIRNARVFDSKSNACDYIELLTKDWTDPFHKDDDCDDFDDPVSNPNLSVNIVKKDYDKMAHIQKLDLDKEVVIYTQMLSEGYA